MIQRTEDAIWQLIGGDTERRIVVNYKDGGERTGKIVSLGQEQLILQAADGELFTIALPTILSVEVIDPGPLALPPEI